MTSLPRIPVGSRRAAGRRRRDRRVGRGVGGQLMAVTVLLALAIGIVPRPMRQPLQIV